jgi:predicted Ser/Thr protein kinase
MHEVAAPKQQQEKNMNDASLPQRIGPYRILGLLGEGATGRVYRAEQREPQREVALKVLKSAGLSADAQQRFRRESELLAQLEHPGIARIYAAGVADGEAGPLPYLAMEYVHGSELLRYVAERGLDLAGRLELLAAIARAVHFAHSRGVVHRDLKPANILVDESGAPRILDFGVAGVIEDSASMTLAGQVLGTVPYMSAEQLAGGGGRSDPRSDVYSLGVIAYQMLSGRLPYPGLSQSTVIEAIAIIREGRVERLSQLRPDTQGDVETVVMKAMAQEAAQRYASAAELAADVERYLQHQPIAARPPTAGYLLGLFVRRHRGLSMAIAFALLALVVGSVVSLRYGLAEARAHREAEQRASELAAVNRFMKDMLQNADPFQSRGRQLTVLEALDSVRGELANDSQLAPGVVATLYSTIADIYGRLGDPAQTVQLAETAEKRLHGQLDLLHPAMARLRLSRVTGMQLSGKSRDAIELIKPLLVLPRVKGEADRLRIDTQSLYAILNFDIGDMDTVKKVMQPLVEEAGTELGRDDQTSLETVQSWATAQWVLGEWNSALDLSRDIIARETAVLGADHPSTLFARQDLAEKYRQLGDNANAEKEIRSVIADRTRVLGADHYSTLLSEYVLCNILDSTGRAAEAVPIIARVADGMRRVHGLNRVDTINAMNTQAMIVEDMGDVAKAEQLYRDTIAALNQGDVANTLVGLAPYNNLGMLLITQRRFAEADAIYAETLTRTERVLGARDQTYGKYLSNWALVPMRQQQWPLARERLEKALTIMDAAAGAQHPATQATYKRLAEVYTALSLPDRAAAMTAKLPPPPKPAS